MPQPIAETSSPTRRFTLQAPGKRVRFGFQFLVLLVFLFCHETQTGGFFASKILLTDQQIRKIHSKQGWEPNETTRYNLIKAELAFNFRAWKMTEPNALLQIGVEGRELLVINSHEQRLGFSAQVPGANRIDVNGDLGFEPRKRFQVLLELNPITNSHLMTFYNRETIDQGLLHRKILQRYAIGSANLKDYAASFEVIKLAPMARQHRLHLAWVKLITQNFMQWVLELLYYAGWAGFWLQLAWAVGKPLWESIKEFGFVKAGEGDYNNVVSFALALQGYLLFSLLAIYLIPDYKFGELPGFLYLARDRFSDFIDVVTYSASRNPYINEFNWDGPIYYPFIMLLLKPLTLFQKDDLIVALVIFVIGSSWYAAHAFAREGGLAAVSKGWWLFVITLSSYPLLFGLDRGNIDLAILLLIVLYLVHLRQGHSWLAGTWLGFAIAAKVFPGLFVLIALRKRDFKAVGMAAAVTLVASLAAMEIFGGEYAKSYEHFQFFYKRYEDVYLINSLVNFNHFSDPFSLLKSLISLGWLPISAETLYHSYSKVALLFIVLISYIVIFKKEPEYIQLALIGVGVVVFPGLAYDYRLVFLFPALYLFFNRQESHSRDKAFWVFLFVILIPKHFGLIEGKWFLTCFVNPIWLLGFLAYCSFPHETWVHWLHRLRTGQTLPREMT